MLSGPSFALEAASREGAGEESRGARAHDRRSGSPSGAASVATSEVRASVPRKVTVPAPIRGLGQSSGFTLELQNTSGLSDEQFKAASAFLRDVHKNVRFYRADNAGLSQRGRSTPPPTF